MALALYGQGMGPDAIRERAGCPRGAIARWIADYQEGARESAFTRYHGIALGPRELARLHGLWDAKYGK